MWINTQQNEDLKAQFINEDLQEKFTEILNIQPLHPTTPANLH